MVSTHSRCPPAEVEVYFQIRWHVILLLRCKLPAPSHSRFKRFNFVSLQVNLKISLPGRVGEQGKNGSKGPKGDVGPIGPEGPQGAKGPTGEKGNKGSPGDDGYQGSKGSKGSRGDKGPQGAKGNDGSIGPLGPPGAPGPSGIGNFSWCEQKVLEVPNAQTATVKDTVVSTAVLN